MTTQYCATFAKQATYLDVTLHSLAYKRLGLDMCYEARAVDNIADAVQDMRDENLLGCAVSMPYKEQVIQYIDSISPAAKAIGAVNTLINQSGHIVGDNTDWLGARYALQSVVPINNKKVLLLGSGGVAKAIGYMAKTEGASHITIYNRTFGTGISLADKLEAVYAGNLENINRSTSYDIIINATSVGDIDNPVSPIQDKTLEDLYRINQNLIVMDSIIYPPNTPLISQASQLGCTTVKGTKMLVAQAVEQIKLYTGYSVDTELLYSDFLKTSETI
ncbi:MAG: shikimate dehydrogenase [Cyanobacteria bacterium J06621_12]